MNKKYTNTLALESSPYLLQHAHNPVDWYPWGEEALTKAKEENKLIIVSIGYAACHWCHVMEHETFEDEDIAKFVNENFISIKVDREERPDIDQIYMNAVNILTGSGGWPLNCITLPDGRPIWGGTYFPKHQWTTMLQKVLDFVRHSPEKAEEQAVSVTKGVSKPDITLALSQDTTYSETLLTTLWNNWKSSIDYKEGGSKGAPKFPLPCGYKYLLEYNRAIGDTSIEEAIQITLDKMAGGGIYDHIGGGFCRYSTDAYWIAPHFEKMLYDNGQLISLYAAAYQYFKNDSYAQVIRETLSFIIRELSAPEGLFYSSLDADSEGEEGKFYVWKEKELSTILGDNAPLIKDYFSVSSTGNWEHGQNILFRRSSLEQLSVKHAIPIDEMQKRVVKAKPILLMEREKRIRPGLDDKILTSWNALMLKGFVDASLALNDESYLEIAIKGAQFIKERLTKKDGSLYRNFKNGTPTINGFLDDYAFTIELYLSLYQATFDEVWIVAAQDLQKHLLEHFLDSETSLFYYTSNLDPALIARKIEVMDNVIPSGNSQMARNLFTLGTLLYDDSLIEQSKQMLSTVASKIPSGSYYFSNWASLYLDLLNPPALVAITGEGAREIRYRLGAHYHANTLFCGGETTGRLNLHEHREFGTSAMIYVCRGKSCKAPTTDIAEALHLLR